MCWGLLLGAASSWPLTRPAPIPQSFGRIRKWLEHARSSPSLTILAGGQCDDSVGYFVEPCIVETKDPQDPIMKEVTGREGLGGQRLRALSRLTAERGTALPGACLTPGESRARPWAQAS